MRQTAVMLLVILSGSLETRALLRQLSEDKARNRRMDFSLQPPQLVMLLCQEQSSAFTSPCVLFFHFACLSRLKAEAETKVPSSSPFLIPAVWSLFEQKKAAFRVQSSPLIFIIPFHCPRSCQPLYFVHTAYSVTGQVQLFGFNASFFPITSIRMSFLVFD